MRYADSHYWLHWRPMKVFLSWSGEPSKAVAQALREWLPDVIQNLRPWMSQQDLGAGVRWSTEIEGELRASTFGVICVTANNRHAPWLNFEAGAMSNKLEGSRVVPYIFDMGFADIEGPLTQFQGKEATKDGTFELVQALNEVAGELGLAAGRLQAAFERMWPELKEKLDAIPKSEAAGAQAEPEQRTENDKLDEVLVLLRNMSADPSERVLRNIRMANKSKQNIDIENSITEFLSSVSAEGIKIIPIEIDVGESTKITVLLNETGESFRFHSNKIISIAAQILPSGVRVEIHGPPSTRIAPPPSPKNTRS